MSLFEKTRNIFLCSSRRRFLLVRMQRCVVITAAFLVKLTLGSFFTFGNISSYILSYIRQRSHPANLSIGMVNWIFVLSIICSSGSVFLGGWLERKIGPRFSTLIGGSLMSSGVLLSYFTINVSYWLLLLTYGLMLGVGVGIAFAGPLVCVMRWMPRWKGLGSGIIASGFGFGALVFDQLQTQYINPHNVKPTDGYFTHKDLLDCVPIIFLILGTTYATLQLVGALLLSNPPQDLKQKNNDNDSLKNSDEEIRNNENYEMRCEITNSHTNMPSIECNNPPSECNEFKDKLVSPLHNLWPSQTNSSSPITEATHSQEILFSLSSSPTPADNPDVHPLSSFSPTPADNPDVHPLSSSSPTPADNPDLHSLSSFSPTPADNPDVHPLSSSLPTPAGNLDVHSLTSSSPAPANNPDVHPLSSSLPTPAGNLDVHSLTSSSPAPADNPDVHSLSSSSPTPADNPDVHSLSSSSPTPADNPDVHPLSSSSPTPADNPDLHSLSSSSPTPADNPDVHPLSSSSPTPADNPDVHPLSSSSPTPADNPDVHPLSSFSPTPADNPDVHPLSSSSPTPADNPDVHPLSSSPPTPADNPDVHPLSSSSPTPAGNLDVHSLTFSSPAPADNPDVHSLSSSSPTPADNPDLHSLSSSSPTPADNPDVHPLQMLKLFGFYHLWSMLLLASFSIDFIATFSKVYGLSFIRDDHFLSAVESVSAIFNSIGRIVWGLVADKFSLETAFILRSGITTVFMLTFYATSAVEFGKPMFLIWMCVIFFCVGGASSLFSAITAHNFGVKYVIINYGFLGTSYIVGGVISALLFPLMLTHLQWQGLIFLVSGVSAAELVLTLLYWRKQLIMRTTFQLTFPRKLMHNIHIRYLKYSVLRT